MAKRIPTAEKLFFSRSTDDYPTRHSVFVPPVVEPQTPVTKLRLKHTESPRSLQNTPHKRIQSQISHTIQIEDPEYSTPRNASLLNPSHRSILEVSPSKTDFRSEASGDWLGGQNFVVIKNPIEFAKYENNHKFGFVKWKSHLATRPLAERSPQVQALYHPTNKPTVPAKINFCTILGNLVYCVCFGWWLSLIYLLFSVIMFMTVCGYQYGFYSFRMAQYFFWPFGKFVYVPSTVISPTPGRKASKENVELTHSNTSINYDSITRTGGINADDQTKPGFEHVLPNCFRAQSNEPFPDDTAPLVHSENTSDSEEKFYSRIRNKSLIKRFCTIPTIWNYPVFWLWLFIAVPFLFFIHLIVFIINWAFVISIPIAKVHKTAMFKLLYLDPITTKIENSDWILDNTEHDIVICTYQAYSRYYIKYTVDGMNVIMFNMFFLVIIALVFDYTIDYMGISAQASHLIKFIISVCGVIPLAYYIGMAIASISAQSTYAVGAVLNATFGSIVEITLYIATLVHGNNLNTVRCSQSIVKNSLTGSLLLTMLLLPGLCMVVGGLKYPEQNFNVRSAGVSSTLLFVSIVGAFAPTFFNKAFGVYFCDTCEWVSNSGNNITNSTHTNFTNITQGLNETQSSFQCKTCEFLTAMYTFEKAQYLAYVCMVLLPVAYIAGMLYSLKTHKHIYQNGSESHGHGKEASPHWGRLKSTFILVFMTILMSLLADTIAENVMQVLSSVHFITPAFLGSTVYAILPDVPEIVTGIQFALQGIISLSIEVGNQIAVQICLLQIPVLLLADIIYPKLGFVLLFNDLQLFSVLMSVLVINYIFSDSKTDYFQGTSLLVIYFIMLSVIFLAPDSSRETCFGEE